MEILTPRVEHGEEADGRTQMFGIRRDGQQGFSDRPEENAVDSPGILQSQGGDLLGQRKHHVEILYRQQLGFSCGQPLRTGHGLTLWTTPVSTRVIRDGAMSALIALIEMSAQSGRSASANIVEGFSLLA